MPNNDDDDDDVPSSFRTGARAGRTDGRMARGTLKPIRMHNNVVRNYETEQTKCNLSSLLLEII